jgi:hypothetical protein
MLALISITLYPSGTMTTSALQKQLADYVSACTFETFPFPAGQTGARVFTIHPPQACSKPILELSEALTRQLAEVTETDTGGTVQELLVYNRSESYLLVYEGSLLKGAKQNRVVNATLLLPPLSRNVIPASCVEQGRWRYSSPRFSSSAYSAPQFLRKTIREQIDERADLKGDQGKVWEEIRRFSTAKQVSNLSHDFEDMYHRSAKTGQLFPPGLQLPSMAGILVETRGECTLDFVASEQAFAGVLPRLLAGYELSAADRPLVALDRPAETLAGWIAGGACSAQPSMGMGTDVRLKTGHCLISALVVEEEVVSLGLTSR